MSRSLPKLAALPLALLLTLGCASQPIFTSTEIHPDRTITFRYLAPAAQNVALILEDQPTPLPMLKSPNGIWTITTPPLKPEIYGYRFLVDGHTQHDPLNPATRYANNLITLPGNQLWERTSAPRGSIATHTYTTKIVRGLPNNQSTFVVYTPPGYDPKAPTPYPTLYLLHCWGDRPDSWNRFGQANIILDNLLAQHKIKPMVVVMPLGYGDISFTDADSVWQDPAAIDHNTTLFRDALLTEVLPQIERLYNVSHHPEARAIIGASMGGLESLTIGLNHPQTFSWIGGISSALDHLDYNTQLTLPSTPASLIWIVCGSGDPLLASNRKLAAHLRTHNLPVTLEEPSGLHSYIVWREALTRFAPLLFQTPVPRISNPI